MSEESEWFYLAGEEQVGPLSPEVLVQLAHAGSILPETLLWTEGLEEWIPASTVEGLEFPTPEVHRPRLIVGAQAQANVPLGGEAPSVMAAPLASAFPALVGATAYSAGPAPANGADYPAPGPMKATFGWFITLPLLAVLAVGGVVALLVSRLRQRATPDGAMTAEDLVHSMLEVGLAFFGCLAFVGLLMLLFQILKLVVLHRAWRALQSGRPRTTPGAAVGLLLVPLFNLYWCFVAYWGLAQDWNRIRASYPNLAGGPRLSEGLAITTCITSVLTPLGSILMSLTSTPEGSSPLTIPVLILAGISLLFQVLFLSGVCKLVNFMGRLHFPKPGPTGTGMRFY